MPNGTINGWFGWARSAWSTLWTSDSRRLKIEFAAPVSRLQIDAVADSDGDFGRLEVFDENDRLLARSTSGVLSAGQFETLEMARPTADIALKLTTSSARHQEAG